MNIKMTLNVAKKASEIPKYRTVIRLRNLVYCVSFMAGFDRVLGMLNYFMASLRGSGLVAWLWMRECTYEYASMMITTMTSTGILSVQKVMSMSVFFCQVGSNTMLGRTY